MGAFETRARGDAKSYDAEHAAKCLRCGRCCYAKVIVDGRVIYTDVPCQYLDMETKLCRIYERRFELNPKCLTVEEGIKMQIFPGDCPYVRGIPNYRPPVFDSNALKGGA